MKKLLFGILLAGLAVSCVGTSAIKGSGKAATGEFDISTDYAELTVSNGITVQFVESGAPVGTIVADELAMEYVSITEKNGKVAVKYDPHVTVRSKVETVVTIPVSRSIAVLRASASAAITSGVKITAGSLAIESSSAAKVTLEVEAGELSVEVNSAADCDITGVCDVCKISGNSAAGFNGNLATRECYADFNSAAKGTLAGTADYCNVDVNSAGSFSGYDLVCKKADVDASSGSSVKITVEEELGVRVSSGASVKYNGSPSLTSQDVSSGGSLKKNG